MTEKNDTKQLINRLEATRNLSRDEWIRLIQNRTADDADYLFERAQAVRTRHYGRSVYIRGLIEFTNYCKNDCYYCGIRCSNKKANRYRLSEEDILRTIALFRYINPDANIRLAAGRALLTNDGEIAFKSGASATITGNMLTTVACATIRSDRQMLTDLGRDVTPDYWKEA